MDERLDDLTQKIGELIGQQKADNKAREQWRTDIEKRLEPVEVFFRRLDTPVKFITWAFAALILSMLAAAGAGVWAWFMSHFARGGPA